MLDVMRICHRMVATEDLLREWRYRASNYSREWLASMVRKNKVRWVRPRDCSDIQRGFDALGLDNASIRAVRKDLRLVEAALAASRFIVTIDTTARDLYRNAEYAIPELEVIRWLNPLDGDRPPGRR